MRIEVDKENKRIEGYCYHSSSEFEDNVISINKIMSRWVVSGSRCMPSNILDAEIILDCMNKAIQEFKKIEMELD